jgi:hypothetical protein
MTKRVKSILVSLKNTKNNNGAVARAISQQPHNQHKLITITKITQSLPQHIRSVPVF